MEQSTSLLLMKLAYQIRFAKTEEDKKKFISQWCKAWRGVLA